MPWQIVTPIVDPSVRGLCVKPYPLHAKGCPNFDKRPNCPPSARLITQILDMSKPVWAIFNRFDLAAHVERMRSKHPNYSDRQLYCCLYWQGHARKQLREEIKRFQKEISGKAVVSCPEACGMNITATMNSIQIALEWPPRKYAYQVVIAGEPI
jgi:hypothetical protein